MPSLCLFSLVVASAAGLRRVPRVFASFKVGLSVSRCACTSSIENFVGMRGGGPRGARWWCRGHHPHWGLRRSTGVSISGWVSAVDDV
jgi:hypothetical protein